RAERPAPAPPQADPLEAADDAAPIGAERETVAPEHPLDRDDRHDDERLHERRERVLLPHHAAVEQRKPGRGHEQHERGRREHPRGVASIDLRGGGGRGGGGGGGGARGGAGGGGVWPRRAPARRGGAPPGAEDG